MGHPGSPGWRGELDSHGCCFISQNRGYSGLYPAVRPFYEDRAYPLWPYKSGIAPGYGY